MIKQFKYIWFLLIILSCKTSNEKIKVNAIKLEYNILFNGDNYFNEGLEVLKNNYKENYWEIIPLIEGLKYSDQSSLVPTKNFLKSEEKAIKAIQKSKNEQIRIRDKAYLLMGKSRFYDQRYISALQAFGQLVNNRQEALLWKTMIYLNLDQVDLALKLIEEEINKEQEVASTNILLARAQSEIFNKNYNKALIDLKNLFRISNDKKIKSRSSFISAQIYSQLNQKDSAKIYYSKTLNSGINKSSEIYLESKLRLLNIIGKLKKNGHTERLIEKLDIKNNIRFHSGISKEEIVQLYSKSSIAIVSSLYEGFGYPVIEAMACGVPLIATKTASIPELVSDKALLVQPKNHDEIAAGINKIFNDYEGYKKKAIANITYIKERFNWDVIALEYNKIISETITNFKK